LSISGPIAAAIPLTGTGSATQYSVSLFWNSTPGATGYNVYRGTSENGRYSKINSTLDANTAYTDSTVVSGQTYYYAATSVNSGGQESALSTPVVEAIVP
jgi:fibronectin type 3 domain-containing protein